MADDWIWVGVLILLAVIVVLFLHFFKKWAKPSQPHGQYQQHQLPLFTRPTTSFPDNVISRDGMKIGTMQDAGTIAPEEAEDCATLLTRAETLTEQPGRASQQEQQHGGCWSRCGQSESKFAHIVLVFIAVTRVLYLKLLRYMFRLHFFLSFPVAQL